MISVLIVDDSFENLAMLTDFIEGFGLNYKVLKAVNGKIAYQILAKKHVDIILTDWQMPVMNGIEFIEKVKADSDKKNIPIIMLTGVMTASNDLNLALRAGAVDYLTKPIEPIELFARIQSVLKTTKYYNELLEIKNKELAQNTLALLKNSRFNVSITKQLKELNDKLANKNEEISDSFSTIINEIDLKIKQDSWHHFEISFKAVNSNFKKNLLEQFPNLSPTEIKYCIFIRMEMSTKEIASILYQSADSVNVTRSRLRKKMNLPSSQNLQSFLMAL